MAKVARKRKRPARKELPPLPPPTPEGFIEIASRASSVKELHMLWRSAAEWGLLTPEVRDAMAKRAEELKGKSR